MSKIKDFEIIELGIEDVEQITNLTLLLNQDKSRDLLISRQKAMFSLDTYKCLGFFYQGSLVGLTSCWTTIKLYSGKQVEVDNVVIDSNLRSKGYGKIFFDLIEIWAKDNGCETIELNTYTHNYRSHKFYFNKGYRIEGFHFQKNFT